MMVFRPLLCTLFRLNWASSQLKIYSIYGLVLSHSTSAVSGEGLSGGLVPYRSTASVRLSDEIVENSSEEDVSVSAKAADFHTFEAPVGEAGGVKVIVEAEIQPIPADSSTNKENTSKNVQTVTTKRGSRSRWPLDIWRKLGEEFAYFITQKKVLRTDVVQVLNDNHDLHNKCKTFCTETCESEDLIKKVYDSVWSFWRKTKKKCIFVFIYLYLLILPP